MKKGGGRNKGNAFERHVASLILKAAVKTDKTLRKRHCYRTPGSGGHRYDKNKYPGDLVIRARLLKIFPFVVECKNYRKIEHQNFHSPQSEKWKEIQWLKQVLRESKHHKRRIPLLVFKANNRPIWCAFPTNKLGGEHNGVATYFIFKEKEWQMMPFEDFLNSYIPVRQK